MILIVLSHSDNTLLKRTNEFPRVSLEEYACIYSYISLQALINLHNARGYPPIVPEWYLSRKTFFPITIFPNLFSRISFFPNYFFHELPTVRILFQNFYRCYGYIVFCIAIVCIAYFTHGSCLLLYLLWMPKFFKILI